MKYQNISELVQKIINDYELTSINNEKNRRIGGKTAYSQQEVLDRINAYINDKYLERDDDALFWNISNSRITHFAKLIGVDTKDFLPYGLGEYNMFQSWALRKMVKKWFYDNSFYQTLNDISEGVATYGSVVWKKYKEDGKVKIKEVDLNNLRFNTSVEWIKETDVVELHTLTRQELYEKKGVWDNVQELLDQNLEEYDVWEFNGYYGDKPEFRKEIGSGFGNEFISLWSEKIYKKDFPYYDFHLGRYRGRWLRVGVVERLFKLQERINQLVNQNAQATEIASLLLFRTANGDAVGNVLEQAINGQIINSDDLQQIGITNTGLNNFINELKMIEQQADVLCLTPSIIQGESTPANTTFRGIAVVSSSAKSAFTAYHQNLGEGIAKILLDDIFPEEAKRWANEPFIEIAEDDSDIQMYDKAMLNYMKKEYLLETGPITPQAEQAIIFKLQGAIEKVGRKVIPEKGWINFKWGIKMMPTNESVDKSTMNDAYFNALNMIGANPALPGIPLFKQYLEDNGITWTKLTAEQQEQLARQGASQLPEQKKPDALLAQAEARQ